MLRILQTGISEPVPVVSLSKAELAAAIAADTAGTTTSYDLLIWGGPTGVPPIAFKYFSLGMGTDLGTSLASIAATVPDYLPGLRAEYANGTLVLRDPQRIYTAANAGHILVQAFRNYPPANLDAITAERFSALGLYTPHQAAHKVIYRPGAPGPWSAVPTCAVLAPPIIEAGPNGWDQMREKLLVPFSPFFTCGERREHMLDERAYPFAHLLSQDERVVGHHGPWPIVELTSLGFAREKPWIIQTTQDTQGEVGSTEGVFRNLPTITVTWFSETLVDTKSIIPGASVPPETFGWEALSITTGELNNHGWVIIKRDVDPLPVITGSRPEVTIDAGNVTRASANLHPRPTLCKVVDFYVYDFINLLPPNN